ncbi:MAG TPA: histidine kinase [Stackebrandtia sp.]|uniref:sensor histidine kinase n=1 Tax=Stackebrandtia sp. TaxID=2023065 RepID=UPI002D31516E|nr:histidine kinase [Stackebrandtia sp.]HZE37536.1 histidine kinase [Stackebrandtia sp.]
MENARRVPRELIAAVVAYAIGVVLVTIGTYSTTEVHAPLWVHLATLTVVSVGVTMRRRAPMIAVLIGTVAFGVDVTVGMSLATAAIYTDNIYAATVYGPRWAPRALLIAGTLLTVVLSALTYIDGKLTTALVICAIFALILLSPVATGMVIREHRGRAELERDRAARIAELAEVDRRAAIATERTRMARELHDTIANHFSAIAMQSSAVLSRPHMDAADMRKVIADIRAGSVAGLADMRRTIELLRTTEAEDEIIQHGLSDLDDLVERATTAGLRISSRVRGKRPELPVAVDLAAYRIVQEALTNVLKHGRDAQVEVDFRPRGVVITVDNRLPHTPAGVPGSGNGLVGMRERATILGGRFEAGPHDGGWRVRAELPYAREEAE